MLVKTRVLGQSMPMLEEPASEVNVVGQEGVAREGVPPPEYGSRPSTASGEPPGIRRRSISVYVSLPLSTPCLLFTVIFLLHKQHPTTPGLASV